MAAGSGSYGLAAIGTGVTIAVLYGLSAADAAIGRRTAKVRRRLEVHISDVKKLEALLKFVRRIDPEAEQLDFKRVGDDAGVLTVSCTPDDLGMMRELLASHRAVSKVEELSPLYWEQGTGNRPS